MSFDERKESAGQKQEPDKLSFEAMQNLVGFFSLLLEIDRRTNPDRYRSE